MPTHSNASRRRDVYISHRTRAIVRRLRRGTALRGVDSHGRFVGLHDIDRASDFFWSQPHRRGSAPIVRSDPIFGRTGPLAAQRGGPGGAGVPRSLEKSGLDFAKLREIHRRFYEGKEPKAVLARDYDVSVNVVTFHLRPSCSMKAALAEKHSAP